MSQQPSRRAWDAVVVGGGPAGLAAGMYLARAGWRCALLEKETLGGQARRLERIENYPGFPSGIRGRVLMRRFAAQAARWGLRTLRAEATAIASRGGAFEVSTTRGLERARSVVSCAGAAFRTLGLPGEERLRGRGVHHDAFEAAPRLAGRRVAVVGGGEAAAHQALLLSRRAAAVYLIHRGPRLKAIALLRRRLARRRNVELVARAVVTRLTGGRALSGIEARSVATGEVRRIPVEALFVLVGKEPRPSLCRWRRPPAGYFEAGDARAGRFRQVAVASGEGVRAAMECERHLAGA